MRPLETRNPANGVALESRPQHSAAEVERRLESAQRARADRRNRPQSECTSECTEVLHRVAAVLRRDIEPLSRLTAREMGKVLPEARSEIEKCAWVCELCADQATRYLAPRSISNEAADTSVLYRPLGTVLAIMPWNFPFWQVFRAAAPALVAGNAVLLKHSENTTGCALEIERLFREAGLADGLFATLLLDDERTNDLIAHEAVQAVTLTGSTRAGRSVGARAGENLKPCVLELGGSDPYLILADADLDFAVEQCAISRLLNAGQSCIAAKRMIVLEELYDAFLERFVERLRAVRMGDPLRDDPTIGPLARHDLRDALHLQVRRSIDAGARCLLGGDLPPGPGAFYPPTVLADVRAGTPAADEELFGPVAAILPVADEEEAIARANDTPYGLGAAVFSRDVDRARRIAADRLEAGSCFVNAFVRSDPRLPFGGVKQSGFGRELSGEGARSFVNVKTLWVDPG